MAKMRSTPTSIGEKLCHQCEKLSIICALPSYTRWAFSQSLGHFQECQRETRSLAGNRHQGPLLNKLESTLGRGCVGNRMEILLWDLDDSDLLSPLLTWDDHQKGIELAQSMPSVTVTEEQSRRKG